MLHRWTVNGTTGLEIAIKSITVSLGVLYSSRPKIVKSRGGDSWFHGLDLGDNAAEVLNPPYHVSTLSVLHAHRLKSCTACVCSCAIVFVP